MTPIQTPLLQTLRGGNSRLRPAQQQLWDLVARGEAQDGLDAQTLLSWKGPQGSYPSIGNAVEA
eukprot:CAMPEP_0178404176 /NCGR_PEP_ID=MMETSP0689_2-20121128/17745_1 /TAXON_ID=160604 /ORGANISM="Amphidinium massartii, Strain CS-259" /LENGTH=63 /DNA_ID=CAMNT_0020025145 /DNA_START=103 /DNA_END=294 /DNA_ORIENTATION=-